MQTDFVVLNYERELSSLGLKDLTSVRKFEGTLVKNHRGHRDILKLEIPTDNEGATVVFFLKRNFKAYRKNGLNSLWRNRSVWSESRIEYQNTRKLAEAGIHTAEVVAYGEDCGPLWERFSFILSRQAEGDQSLDEWAEGNPTQQEIRYIGKSLASLIRKMHSANLATPDLFARHIFIEKIKSEPRFTLIDMARLDQLWLMSDRRRARDLAALNLSIPLRYLSMSRRLEFLIAYTGSRQAARRILIQIRKRVNRVKNRSKFQDYFESDKPGTGLR